MLVTVAGFATAFFRLGAKGLWGDEVWEVSWSQQQSFVDTLRRFSAPPDLPLQFLLTRLATTKLASNEWTARLPAALLGAFTVVLLYLLARKIFGTRTALLAGLLLAAAPYHVWYSQDARPYAGLAFYSLLSLYCFYEVLKKPSWLAWIGFTVATTLNIYNHLFGMFPLITEAVFTVLWVLAMTVVIIRARGEIKRVKRRLTLTSLFALATGALLSVALSYPLLPGITNYILHGGPGEVEAPPFRISLAFLYDIFGLLGTGIGWPFWLLAFLFSIGVAAAIRRGNWFILVALAWLAVPFLILVITQPRHIFIPRYFLFMQPVYLLLVGFGLLQVAEFLVKGVNLLVPATRKRPVYSISALGALSLVVLGLTFTPSWRIYWVEKLNDWSSACSYLQKHAECSDVVVGDAYIDGITYWCFKMMPGAPDVNLIPLGSYDISDLTRAGRNVWYVQIDPSSPNRPFVEQNYNLVARTDWTRENIKPAQSDGDRLLYPQAENMANIYYYKSPYVPDKVTFHEVRGRHVAEGWPDYAQIVPHASMCVRLSLPSSRPRVMRLTYLDLAGRDIEVSIAGKPVKSIKAGASRGAWIPIDIPIPNGVSDIFEVELRNPGSDVSAVSEIAVVNAGSVGSTPIEARQVQPLLHNTLGR